jgi:hypothetical protein
VTEDYACVRDDDVESAELADSFVHSTSRAVKVSDVNDGRHNSTAGGLNHIHRARRF